MLRFNSLHSLICFIAQICCLPRNGVLQKVKACSVALLLLAPFALRAGQTTVVFQPDSILAGPFPTNKLTVADSSRKTGLRVQIGPDAQTCSPNQAQAVCGNVDLLNQLDGFSINPRFMVCFSDEVSPETLKSGLKLISLDSPGTPLPLNQFLYHHDAGSRSYCGYAKPDQVLNQQSRYLLLVTDAITDISGNKVQDDGSFANALVSSDAYDVSLASALSQVSQTTVLPGNVIAASLFTTMSATSWLQEAYQYVHQYAPGLIMPASFPNQFQVSDLSSMLWNCDQGISSVSLPIPLSALSNVGSVEFGLFLSPNFLTSKGSAAGSIVRSKSVPPGAPNVEGSLAQGFTSVSFHVFLPSTPMPSGGWPVVIYGHGLGDSQFGAPTFIASTLAANGYATLAIEIAGHGNGPNSTVALKDKSGNAFSVSTPGRSGQTCISTTAIGIRDCARQSAVDLFALVHALQQTGTDTLGLNPQRIYYVGQSLGAVYGSLFHAVEPSVSAAVLSVGGGSNVDVARLSPAGRPLGMGYLGRMGLLNVPPAPLQTYFRDGFNDDYVYRDEPTVKISSVYGASAIQSAFESAEWLGMLGDPLAFAPHLQKSPLAGVPVKSTFFQYSLGDLEEPNPVNSAFIRAAGLQSSSWLFRFDWAVASAPQLLGITSDSPLPILPHRILSNPTIFDNPAEQSIALAEQQATAAYFYSNGQIIPNPNSYLSGFYAGATLFEQPAKLPDRLNFLQITK